MKKKTVRKNQDIKKRKKIELCFCLCMALILCSVAVYDSFDLLLQDYVVQQGIYDRTYRSRFGWELYFREDGEVKTVFSHDLSNELVVGERYEYTYAKRTRALLEIHKISEK